MTGQHGGHQQDGGDLGELRGLHMHPCDADPALSSEGGGADQPHRHKAGHGEDVDRNQQRSQPAEGKPLEHERDHRAHGCCDPVLIPVRIVSLTLRAGDQNARDRHHRQRNTPEHPFPLSPPSAAAGAEHPQVGCPTVSAREAAWNTASASCRNSWALVESGRLVTIGRPASPASCSGISIGI